MRPPSRLLAAVAVNLLLVGCVIQAGGSPNPSVAPTPPPGPTSNPAVTPGPIVTPTPMPTAAGFQYDTGPNALVLRIKTSGGLVPPGYYFGEVPDFSLYGDGRVIVTGPVPAIYPGPALPNLVQFTLDSRQMTDLLVSAEQAGLFGPDVHYDYPGLYDGSTTVFESHVNGDHTISAYALGLGSEAPEGMSSDVVAGRHREAPRVRESGPGFSKRTRRLLRRSRPRTSHRQSGCSSSRRILRPPASLRHRSERRRIGRSIPSPWRVLASRSTMVATAACSPVTTRPRSWPPPRVPTS